MPKFKVNQIVMYMFREGERGVPVQIRHIYEEPDYRGRTVYAVQGGSPGFNVIEDHIRPLTADEKGD